MTLKHAQAELKSKQAEVKKMDSGYKKDQDALQAARSSREKLEAGLAKLNYEGSKQLLPSFSFISPPNQCDNRGCVSAEGKEESLLEKRRQLSRQVSQLKETYERLMSRFPNLRFDYK